MTLQFIGADRVLFQGERRNRKVRVGIACETKSVRTYAEIVGGEVIFGVRVFANEKAKEHEAEWCVKNEEGHPLRIVAAARTLMLTELDPEISLDNVIGNAIAAGPQNVAGMCHAVDRVGVAAFKRVMSEMSPNLFASLKFLEQNGIEADLQELTQEVRLGNLVYNEALRELGVEDPAPIDAKRRREEDALAPILPQLEAYVTSLRHRPGCSCIHAYKAGALDALNRGISDPSLAIGMASLKLGEYQGSPIIALLWSAFGTGDDDKHRISIVSSRLAEVIESQKPKPQRKSVRDLTIALSDLSKNWDSLPVNNL